MQEVHERQAQLLLEWHTIDKQGEGPPESPSTETTHSHGWDQDKLPPKGDWKNW